MKYGQQLVVLAFVGWTIGCAGAGGGSTVSLAETRELFNAAKFSGAVAKSPYEFYAAEIYLNQAQQAIDKGQPGLADPYLIKAHDFAAAAYQNAKKFRKIELR
jgi:hypothetical protein